MNQGWLFRNPCGLRNPLGDANLSTNVQNRTGILRVQLVAKIMYSIICNTKYYGKAFDFSLKKEHLIKSCMM